MSYLYELVWLLERKYTSFSVKVRPMSESETQAYFSRTVPSHAPTYQKSAMSVRNIVHIMYMIHRLSQLLRTSIKYLIEE